MKVGLFLLLVVICTLPAEAQCAMCRAVLESEQSGTAAKGINNGIMYLMVFPYLLKKKRKMKKKKKNKKVSK
jgi:hypothetical protein